MSKASVYNMLADVELEIETELFSNRGEVYEKEFGRRDVMDALAHCQIRRKALRALAEEARDGGTS